MTNQTPSLTKSFEAEGLKNLSLETQYGNIELVGHTENTIKVEIFATVRGISSLFFEEELLPNINTDRHLLAMDVMGETLKIFSKPDYLNPFAWFRKTSFRVYIPASISSLSKTYAGKIKLVGVKGSHSFSTWGGNLSIENCDGNLFAKTMGGKILLKENQGEIKTDSMGGNIYIQKHNGKINTATWGGNIEASDVFGDFECSTMGGNIRLQNINGNIGASTKGGNITVNMPSIHQYAWFDTSGGNIKMALPLDNPIDFEVSGSSIYYPPFQNFQGNISHNKLYGKLNGGGKHITAKTRGGSVSIENTILPPPQSERYFTENQHFNAPKNEVHTHKFNTPKAIPASTKESLLVRFKEGLFGLFFCVLMVYGLSAVLYFMFELANPKSVFSTASKGIFYVNLNNGINALVAVVIFINAYEFRIRSTILKYISLFLMSSIYVLIFNKISMMLFWNKAATTLSGNDFNILYAFIPPLVSCAYFFYWQKTRSITRKISEQEYQLLNLEKLKSKAQLDALEAKINPHFLYNSLNSIAGLIHDKPDKAEEMTIQLSKLFRYTTGRNDDNFHTIADELEIIKAYLAIEQVRFGTRLIYSIHCQENILTHKIPRFLLQPLVENAIKHGISKIAHAGEIKVEITERSPSIWIKIHDNGPDFGEDFGGGFGLRSIKEKLKIVYAEKATFELQNQPQKAVVISFPV